MDVIKRYVDDIKDLVKGVPPMLYVHALMIIFALQNISFYFEPLVSNLKIQLLYWITCAYFPVFIVALIFAKEKKWFYYIAIILGLYALILMVQNDVEYVPGAKITINYWPIAYFYMAFLSWPILALPFYLYSVGLSWKTVLILYIVVFAITVICKEYLEYKKKHIKKA